MELYLQSFSATELTCAQLLSWSSSLPAWMSQCSQGGRDLPRGGIWGTEGINSQTLAVITRATITEVVIAATPAVCARRRTQHPMGSRHPSMCI